MSSRTRRRKSKESARPSSRNCMLRLVVHQVVCPAVCQEVCQVVCLIWELVVVPAVGQLLKRSIKIDLDINCERTFSVLYFSPRDTFFLMSVHIFFILCDVLL